MKMEKLLIKTSWSKRLSWAGIGLCGLCCALPIIGGLAGIGSLAAFAFYLEKIGIFVLGLGVVIFLYSHYRKKQQLEVCSPTCETNCRCKSETTS